jgi:hypothetical protein
LKQVGATTFSRLSRRQWPLNLRSDRDWQLAAHNFALCSRPSQIRRALDLRARRRLHRCSKCQATLDFRPRRIPLPNLRLDPTDCSISKSDTVRKGALGFQFVNRRFRQPCSEAHLWQAKDTASPSAHFPCVHTTSIANASINSEESNLSYSVSARCETV